ncbi:MAG: hypothetical protein DRH90_14715 [Deltaproteobacteria bacterium]|nr:MAG: hypothetical protein DRH90_14715 [Deltaproteobacteria bacterium]
MPTEKEMLDQLRQGRVELPPLTFSFLDDQLNVGEDKRIDAYIEVKWKRKSARFAVECKALSTPKFFQNSINYLKSLPLSKNVFPMLFMPFLSERQLKELEREGISGIDLCGNCVVVYPGTFSVFRSGGKNRFPSSAAIKNIYRKNSSMVGRGFFVYPDFQTVQDIRATINHRNLLVNRWNKKPMSLSTVSKVLKTMVEDLIITRTETIRLLQPDKLLEKLRENYNPPVVKERMRLKIPENDKSLLKLLSEQSKQLELPLIASGISSVTQYTVMQRGDLLTVYCPKVELLLKRLPGSQTDRFPNLELLETEDELVYFDGRQEDGFWWASPLQVYMELMAGDKRDQETAEQLKALILNDAGVVQQ